MKENIKIVIEKKDKNKSIKNYISKDEFNSINDNNITLKYIRLMRKIKDINKEEFLKNILNILFEISIKNVDISDMKTFVNNYYKHIKLYKKHMLYLSINNESKKDIIDFYVNLFEKNDKLNINSIRYIFHLLYNEKILSDKSIIEWYHNLDEKNKFSKNNLLKDFIEWLENQSSSDSEDGENSDNQYSESE